MKRKFVILLDFKILFYTNYYSTQKHFTCNNPLLAHAI